jgi:hypothetical protein
MAKWFVFGLIALATGAYYKWEVRATGNNFVWDQNYLGGYYNYLAHGFTDGHLYLPVEPDPRLLALPNPIDPKAGVDLPKLFDAVLYNRHYYLYHGAGPAVMLFYPWRALTHRDLPENYALYLLCFGGFLFSALTLMYLVDVKPWLLAVMLVALACCTSLPFLMNRIWVYEIAIGGGYFCMAAALYFFVRGWDIPSGLMFGMAVACRPHLGFIAGFAVLALAVSQWRRLLRFVPPLALVGIAIAAYNFARFGNPLEFGLTWQITGEYQGRVVPRMVNVIPGLFYNLLAGIDFSRVFPFLVMPEAPRIVPRPPEYFIEPIVGALWLAPFLPAAFGVFFIERLRTLIWFVPVSALTILFFLTTTGLSTQRYEVDFLPWLALSALAVIAELKSRALNIALMASVAFGTVLNASMGITGPYDEITRNKPARYLAIAKFFSPLQSLRPQLNPAFDERFSAPIPNALDHETTQLFHAGQPPYRYELFIDHLNGKPALVSKFGMERIIKEVPVSKEPVAFEVRYLPASGEAVVTVGGSELIRHKLGTLIAAPVEIAVISKGL